MQRNASCLSGATRRLAGLCEAAPPAAPRRISGALSESGCAAQPAEHAPDERRATRARRRRRGRRADARVVGVGSAGEARRPASAPAGGCAAREARQKTLLKGSGAACRRAARRASPLPATRSRARSHGPIQRAIAPEAARPGPVGLPRQLVEAVQSAESMLGRLPSSDEPCWLLAGGELEDARAERRRAMRARPLARGRRRGSQASWRLWQALTCQKAPRSARDVTKVARLGAARSTSPSARPPGASEPTGAPRQ